MCELHQKLSLYFILLFLQLADEKKTPFLVQLKQIFGPSYFVRALEQVFHFIKKILSKQVNAGSDISPSTKIRKKSKKRVKMSKYYGPSRGVGSPS